MEELITALTRFYGLDWLTMLLGLTGMWLLSRQDKRGFAINAVACMASLSVAFISGQSGFIAYNLILIVMMVKGFRSWNDGAARIKSGNF